jgi:PmbA protein
MMIQVTELLKKRTDITAWRVTEQRRTSYEAFFIRRDLETVRTTDTCDTSVTIYLDHDDFTGDASFTVYASTDEAAFERKLNAAIERAGMINNRRYTLPTADTLSRELPSGFAAAPMSELCAKVAAAAIKADCYEGGSINAMEVFLYKTTTHIENSLGIDKTETKYHAMIEAIPTWTENGESVELYEQYTFGEPNYDEITAEIDQRMQEVHNRYLAKKPETMPTCRVVLPTQELAQLLSELSEQLDYFSVYSHSNAFSKGDMLQKERTGDPLTITLRGEVAGCCRGAAFDGDGVTLCDTTVIKDGQAVAYHGSNRYAQYLGEPVTGILPVVTVQPGTLSDTELASAPYFLCVSMSGLQLDIYSDYIGGEVRLAYYVEDGKITPMTGISISGKLSDALRGVRFSDRTVTRSNYQGPALAAFEGIAVV